MNAKIEAKTPFRFSTRLHLSELTGLKAANIMELLDHIKTVSGSCIYHHTHRFLQQHQYLSPEPPNDFAYWVDNMLGESVLGENLASIDVISYPNIRSLRDKIVSVIEEYISFNPEVKLKFAAKADEFHFIKSVSFVVCTPYEANNLWDFIEILEKITINSIYYHVFESRLRLEKETSDFSNWIENSIADKELADKISKIDPYTYTLEDLRRIIIEIIKKRIS